MTQELKDIFDKNQANWTDDEQGQVKEAVDSFKTEIDEVCKKHELAYKSVLQFGPDGVVPSLHIVRIQVEEEKK